MRKLNLSDVFRFSRMVKATKAAPVVEELLAMASSEQEKHRQADSGQQADSDAWLIDVGIRGFLRLLDCASEQGAESAVYKFLAPVWEMEEKTLMDMTLETVIANMAQMFRENDMLGFFDYARKVTGM